MKRTIILLIAICWFTNIVAQPRVNIYDNPKSNSLWLIRGDTCLLLAKSDIYAVPTVRGIFALHKIFGSADSSAVVYSLKPAIDPGALAADSMTVERFNEPALSSDTIYVSVNLPNYPQLRCVILADGLFETFGTSGAGTLKFHQDKNTLAARGKTSFSLFPVVSGQDAYSGRRTRYDFTFDTDTTFNRVEVTLPDITSTLIDMIGADNETIIRKGDSIIWRGTEYRLEPHLDGVADKLMEPRHRPPYVPAKRTESPLMTLDMNKIKSKVAWGRTLRGKTHVDIEALGDLYEPRPASGD